tara:strand:- start:9000 stop:12227 length:3228 start_codon:yes stop_codon:yes gene_type:complete
MVTLKKISLFIFFLSCCLNYAQNQNSKSLKILDSLINIKAYDDAQIVLNQNIDAFRTKKSYYLLTDYIYYTGKINLHLHDQQKASSAVNQFIESILSETDSVKVIRQTDLELSSYYELINDTQKAYEANLNALKLTSEWDKATPEDFGLVENNLGTLANRKGYLALGLKHHINALKHYESYPKTNKTNLYILYNSLGGSMWYVSKIDSALYYYEKAEKTLDMLEPDPMNTYYRPAILNNNIAGIYSTQGNFKKALTAMKQTINHLNEFLKTDVKDSKKESAKEFLFMSIENYAGIYKDLGDFEKTRQLLEYSYSQKKKHFDAENPELFKAKILLGQIYFALKDYKLSETYLTNGLNHINRVNGGNGYWAADVQYSLALLNEELNNIDKAKEHYDKAETLYEATLQGAYDELYLDFIINASDFYANNNEKEKALNISKKAYNYIKENQGTTTSFEIQQLLNRGELYFKLGDYNAALNDSNETIELLKKMLPTQTNPLDSLKTILYKPKTILLKAKSEYHLNAIKDSSFLIQQFHDVKEAISILEKQKALVGDDSNVSHLIDKNSNIFEFAKQLALEIYEITQNKTYLNDVMSLHESLLYNRIRSRLHSNAYISYANIPASILEKEKDIQSKLKNTLSVNDNIDNYLKASAQWQTYLELLKKEYPKYYKMQYATIEEPLDNLQKNIPRNTTLVRYLSVDKSLYAAVITASETHIFKLNNEHVNDYITQLAENKSDFKTSRLHFYELYQKLWKPFESKIKTENIIIFPDGNLFNLSFETLTPEKINSYKELATKSLLGKHNISYNYSLLLLNENKKTIDYQNDFIAFAPEFNDKMKKDYSVAITDSLSIDKTYLNLLPQPFSVDLAKEYSQLFNGSYFINENASKQIFKNEANEHKIIHIGTHAESNNISPELSRLIFAKNSNDEDNSLYTYEIYNENLNANLAILTACETGKPTYQAGEGMISLAHAFNYAGSESILTSLWKIDETSSAKIIELFYNNIKNGLPKDKALRQAKLHYISTAEGRTVAPEYWAGLVLIGDASSIDLHTSSNLIWYFLIAAVAIVIAFFSLKKRKKREKL